MCHLGLHRFLTDVCDRINDIYGVNGVLLSWTLEAPSENDSLKPDFRLLRPGAPGANKADVMVGEGKVRCSICSRAYWLTTACEPDRRRP